MIMTETTQAKTKVSTNDGDSSAQDVVYHSIPYPKGWPAKKAIMTENPSIKDEEEV